MTEFRFAIVAPHFAEYSERMAAGLARRGPTLLFLNTINRQSEVPEAIVSGALVLAMPMNRRPHQLAAFARIVWRLLVFRPSVVIVQEGVRPLLKALFVALKPLFRIALIVHDPEPHSGRDSADRAAHMRYRAWLRRSADVLIVHGRSCFEEMVRLGYEGRGMIVINHGVLMVPRKPRSIAPEPGRVLIFGRMEAYKGTEVLLAAVEILNREGLRFELMIAGAGPEQARLAARIASLGNVRQIDRYLTPDELEVEIARSVFVVAPYTDATQSGVLATTFANGRPVIASAIGGLPDVVRDGVKRPSRSPQRRRRPRGRDEPSLARSGAGRTTGRGRPPVLGNRAGLGCDHQSPGRRAVGTRLSRADP